MGKGERMMETVNMWMARQSHFCWHQVPKTTFVLDKAQLWDRGEFWGSVHPLSGKASFFLYLCLLCISEHHHLAPNSSLRWIWVQRRNSRPGQIVLRAASVKEFDVGLEDYLWKSAMAQIQSLLAGFLQSPSLSMPQRNKNRVVIFSTIYQSLEGRTMLLVSHTAS